MAVIIFTLVSIIAVILWLLNMRWVKSIAALNIIVNSLLVALITDITFLSKFNYKNTLNILETDRILYEKLVYVGKYVFISFIFFIIFLVFL